jgi:cell fate regulator YaaT (PSP1 superfamily)
MSDFEDEDISLLEDRPEERETTSIVGQGVKALGLDSIAPDTPIYRLRLSYSHETFLAIYREDTLTPGSMVIVPTRYGRDLAQVMGPVRCRHDISDIAWIERSATKEDEDKALNNNKLEKEAFKICKDKIEKHQLEMKLVQVHYVLEEPKILFFFTADNRVDFRELVKDLVSVFKTRIELRQIGVRDEARVVSGLGICGRGYCCHAVSDKIKPVSIKMAKEQNLSFNSMKISGPCGRLLCCLSYEYAFYSEQLHRIPQPGARVNYNSEQWTVSEANMVTGQVKMTSADSRIMTLPSARFEHVENQWRVKNS